MIPSQNPPAVEYRVQIQLTVNQVNFLLGTDSDLYNRRTLKIPNRRLELTPGLYEFIENEADKTYYGNSFPPGEIRMRRSMFNNILTALNARGLKYNKDLEMFIKK